MQTAGSHTHALASSQKCGIFLDFQPGGEEEDLSLSQEFKILPAAAALITGIRVCVSHADDAEQLSFTDSSERTKTA